MGEIELTATTFLESGEARVDSAESGESKKKRYTQASVSDCLKGNEKKGIEAGGIDWLVSEFKERGYKREEIEEYMRSWSEDPQDQDFTPMIKPSHVADLPWEEAFNVYLDEKQRQLGNCFVNDGDAKDPIKAQIEEIKEMRKSDSRNSEVVKSFLNTIQDRLSLDISQKLEMLGKAGNISHAAIDTGMTNILSFGWDFMTTENILRKIP